jgi:hypothetical protein
MPPVLPTERIAYLGTVDCCIHPPGRNETIAITPPIISSKEVAQKQATPFPHRPRNGRRARKGVAGSGTAARGHPDGKEDRVAVQSGQSQIKTVYVHYTPTLPGTNRARLMTVLE